MMRHGLLHIALLMLCTAWAAEPVSAQRFDTAARRNTWNEGVNRAGLREDSLSMSYAEVQFAKQNGGMTDHSVSADSWSAGVLTESMRHFRKISFAGRFAYDYTDSKDICGSMSIRPGFYPTDIYEFTPGRKILENYAFTGGMSADLGSEWRAGLHVDFLAANYAKRKDLRHKNTLLDFEIAPSAEWRRGDWRVGAAYIFAKNSESIEASEKGTTTDSYEAFFDRGLFYGDRSLWDSNIVHLKETGVSAYPVKESMNGAALQLQWRMLFGEAEYRRSSGETGERGLIWHTFGGDAVKARITASLRSGGGEQHFVRFYADWSQRSNSENILVRETEGGVTLTSTIGSVPIYTERRMSLRGEYEWLRQNGSGIRAGIEWNQRNSQSSLVYPQLREQRLGWWRVWAEGVWAGRRAELTAGAWIRKGCIDEWERTESSQMSSHNNYPERLSSYAAWNADYMTALRAGVKLGVRINIAKGFYAEASARYEHGFRLTAVPQPNRIESLLSVGYKW